MKFKFYCLWPLRIEFLLYLELDKFEPIIPPEVPAFGFMLEDSEDPPYYGGFGPLFPI